MDNFHTPVLLKEVIENLRIEKDKKYIDATIGGGGHAVEILKLGGKVLGIDVDREAIGYIKDQELNIKNSKNLILVKGNFRDIDEIAKSKGFDKVAGIIFDLGASSHQLERQERGFSFQKEGPLDMRMDQELAVRALDLIKILTKRELYEIFTKFGEENRAWAISERIVSSRKMKPIKTTKDLTLVVGEAFGIGGSRSNFAKAQVAKRVFQALRIAVNDELDALEQALPKAISLLEKNGKLAVISFHSLEDRIVKKEFIKYKEKKLGVIITEKPIIPEDHELKKNWKARSAKLRIFEKSLI
ncbi:MAG: 16S rRNA (cytosine(1402)-N(4))-methyltransferase RsmH [Candidatus Levybacteria bacterium]|nr:16S rRNA (cytosine(1402)-N(4))-methyltransferase RsmH [Candidatus Levybacteria bacterium]